MPLVTLYLSPNAPKALSLDSEDSSKISWIQDLELLLRTQFKVPKGVLQLNVVKTINQTPWSEIYMSIRCKDILPGRSVEKLNNEILPPIARWFEGKGITKGAIRLEKFDERIGAMVKWGESKL